MTAALVLEWVRTAQLELPLPGSAQTAQRWHQLARLTEIDVVAGRLAEAHINAVAILSELEGPPLDTDELWGVWAAEAPDAVVTARGAGDALVLDGTEAWCCAVCSTGNAPDWLAARRWSPRIGATASTTI